jgi:hypothetical protein
MLDTVKLGIPLTERQHTTLLARIRATADPQWVLWHPQTNEIDFKRVRGLARLENQSFHRNVNWDIPEVFNEGFTFFTLELSLPKYFYGHNIALLYDFVGALNLLKKELSKQLRCNLCDVMEWQLWRVDCCYAWDLGTYQSASIMLDSIKHLDFPRKTKTIYETAITYTRGTFSLKFYLKYPEFRKHDVQALVKKGIDLAWIEHWEELSKPVLRFEATLRRQYLQNHGFQTVADLVRPHYSFELKGDWPIASAEQTIGLEVTLLHLQAESGLPLEQVLKDGLTIKQPNQAFLIGSHQPDTPALPDLETWTERMHRTRNQPFGGAIEKPAEVDPQTGLPSTLHAHGIYYGSEERSVTVRVHENPAILLSGFLTKLLGESHAMNTEHQVKAILLENFKATKATRLIGFWLYVQRFGSNDAKEHFGKTPYYDAKKDLKSVGISLVEPPVATLSFNTERLLNFKFQVPSPYVTNVVDDFRDSENVANLAFRRLSRQQPPPAS